MKNSVFVTYCWGDKKHNDEVLSFTDFLGKKGFKAEMDRLKSQEEASIDFTKMMNVGITSCNKVIIVLSKGYKKRAEGFIGGVGKEYNLIIKDIPDNPKKYVLVSLQGISDDIVPLSLKDRDIVDLKKGEKELDRLYAKLTETNQIKFAEVGKERPKIHQHEIADWIHNKNKDFELERVDKKFKQGSLLRYDKYVNDCRRTLKLIFTNKSRQTIEGCQIELIIKADFLYNNGNRFEQNNNLKTVITNKIFHNQEIETHPIEISISYYNFKEAENSNITAKIFSDLGEQLIEIPILNCVTENKNNIKRRIELDDFLETY